MGQKEVSSDVGPEEQRARQGAALNLPCCPHWSRQALTHGRTEVKLVKLRYTHTSSNIPLPGPMSCSQGLASGSGSSQSCATCPRFLSRPASHLTPMCGSDGCRDGAGFRQPPRCLGDTSFLQGAAGPLFSLKWLLGLDGSPAPHKQARTRTQLADQANTPFPARRPIPRPTVTR